MNKLENTSNTLWSAWLDYYGTGEGRTIMGVIGYAHNAEEARTMFTEIFPEWRSFNCYTQIGVANCDPMSFLFSSNALMYMLEHNKSANIKAHACIHLNAS